jgi:mono/diheme cytochrome c family protein
VRHAVAGTALAVALATLALAGTPAAAEDARVLYLLHCQGCHLADGSGSPGAVPPLAGVARFATLPEGRAYLVGVPGSAQAPLSDAELARVLSWMLGEFGPAEVAATVAPFSAAEVAALRRPLADVASARQAVLRELEGSGAGAPEIN